MYTSEYETDRKDTCRLAAEWRMDMKKMAKEVNVSQVKVADGFWSGMQEKVIDVVIPFQEKVLNDEVPGVAKSHAIENFRIAAGLSQGEFYGMVFQDSDLFNWRNGWRAWPIPCP